jgi:hypothetical protein
MVEKIPEKALQIHEIVATKAEIAEYENHEDFVFSTMSKMCEISATEGRENQRTFHGLKYGQDKDGGMRFKLYFEKVSRI